MHFNLILPSLIRADWGRIGAALRPEIESDPARQEADVYRDLMNGDMALFDLNLAAIRLLVVIEYADDRTCWLLYLAGRIEGAGRIWLGRVRMLVRMLEQMAARNGCRELRIEGRDWSRVLPDYSRCGDRNELMKVIG